MTFHWFIMTLNLDLTMVIFFNGSVPVYIRKKAWPLQRIAKCAFGVSLVLIFIWFGCSFHCLKNKTPLPFGEKFCKHFNNIVL